jgi:voltage-gated potassium channel
MERKKVVYDVLMMGLALIVVGIIMLQMILDIPTNLNKILEIIDFTIWIIFVIDYFWHLAISESKKTFIYSHKIDLISIIPLNSLFKAFRIFRLTRMLKFIRITKSAIFITRFSTKLKEFLKTNGFNYVLVATISILFIGSILISIVENMNIMDAIWWSFVTTTTVGYGDISPITPMGKIIASVLMIVGIGFVGMLTGTISTYFLSRTKKDISYRGGVINDIKIKLDDFDHLEEEDIKDICAILLSLKENYFSEGEQNEE